MGVTSISGSGAYTCRMLFLDDSFLRLSFLVMSQKEKTGPNTCYPTQEQAGS